MGGDGTNGKIFCSIAALAKSAMEVCRDFCLGIGGAGAALGPKFRLVGQPKRALEEQ